jgi:ABC-2 type transport system permease protein
VHRVAALARAEGLLLRRNRLALLTAVALPALLVGWLKTVPLGRGAGGFHGAGATVLTGLLAFALLFAVYYNLVAALAGRREQLVLKRLRTGEATDGEILAGTAAPAIAVAWTQVAVAAVAAVTVFGLVPSARAVLALVALVGGSAVFALLAAVSSALTRTVEMAQVTTTPVIFISFVFSGLTIPLSFLPGPAQAAAQALPMTSVVDLMRLGLAGTAADGHQLGVAASFGAALIPVLVLAAWIGAGAWAARRWFRWEPRR